MVSGFGWIVKADGAIAQLGERLLCKQEVVGSIPSGSTNSSGAAIELSLVHENRICIASISIAAVHVV